MRERVYSGVINGERFRYSRIMNPEVEDRALMQYEEEHTDRLFAEAFVRNLIEKGVITVETESFEFRL